MHRNGALLLPDSTCLTVSHDPEIVGVEPGCSPLLAHSRRRLVHRLVSQLERSPMGRGHNPASFVLRCRQLRDSFDAIFRVHVDPTHEPTPLIRSNPKDRPIAKAPTLSDYP